MKKMILSILIISTVISLASCSSKNDVIFNSGSESNSESESVSVSTSDTGSGGQPCYSPPKSYSYEELANKINGDNREFPCDDVFLKIAETITPPNGLKFYYYSYVVTWDYEEAFNSIRFEIAWKQDDSQRFCGIGVSYYPEGDFKPYRGFEQIQGTPFWKDDQHYMLVVNEFYFCSFSMYDEMVDLETYMEKCLTIEEIINEQAS